MRTSFASAAVALAFGRLVAAQTFSACNPVKGDKCPANAAFGGEASIDFLGVKSIEDLESFFIVDGGIKYGDTRQVKFDAATGMELVILEEKNAPTLISHDYLFFGRVEVEMQAAPGAGIISSIVLQSDSLDEIDWEFVGAEHSVVQTNVFYKGVEDYTHGGKHELAFDAMEGIHTYALDWTPERIIFSVDGAEVRTLTPDEGVFPQTPCQLRLGTWVAGKGDAQGTIDWSGGLVDWSKGPFSAHYRRVSITDYAGGHSGAKEYEYSNSEGTWESIKVVGGSKSGFPGSDVLPVDNHQKGSTAGSSVEPSVSAIIAIETSAVESSSAVPSSVSSSVSSAAAASSSEEASSTITSSEAPKTTSKVHKTTTVANSTSVEVTSSFVPSSTLASSTIEVVPSASASTPAVIDDESAASRFQIGGLVGLVGLVGAALML